MMESSLSIEDLGQYTSRLLAQFIPDPVSHRCLLSPFIDFSIQRLEYCFGEIKRKYYQDDTGKILFNHLNSDHFCSYLYFLANSIWKETQDPKVPERLFYLNKIMHGIDLFYSVELPPVFLLVHPLGTVLGRAKYGNYFVAYQNVSVGSDVAGEYPVFGEGVVLYSKTSVIGKCHLGNNVCIGANSFLLNTNVDDNSVVVGQYPNIKVSPATRTVKQRHFEKLT